MDGWMDVCMCVRFIFHRILIVIHNMYSKQTVN